jgi:curved DNA-binding protein CbpA
MVEKDYYSILGLSRSASQEEIKKAFFKLAKKYHPDKHRGAEGGEYEVKFAQINEAYNVLKDQSAKVNYDARVKAAGDQKTGSPQSRYKAEELFHTAVKAMKLKDFNSAIDLLKAAVRLEPEKADYYSALGLALSEKPRRLHEAREMCEKAVEIEPYDVGNYINLGRVYKKAGLHIRAQRQFEKALHWDPQNWAAREELKAFREQGLLDRAKSVLRRFTSSK